MQASGPTGGFTAAEPPYIVCVLIEPDNDTEAHVPVDGVVLAEKPWDESGFAIADGTASTVDMTDRFIRAASNGGHGGGTGGSLTHTHSPGSHTHTSNAHTHGNAQFTTGSSTVQLGKAPDASHITHSKFESIGNTSISITSQSFTVNAASSEPEYHKLLPLQNKGASAATPNGTILPYTGLSGDLPSEWFVCDGTNGTPDLSTRQIKMTGIEAEVGQLGGYATHVHTTLSHTHSQTAHNHTYVHNQTTSPGTTGKTNMASGTHTHTGDSMDTTTSTILSTAPTSSAFDGRYLYTNVLFILKRTRTVHFKGGKLKGGKLAA